MGHRLRTEAGRSAGSAEGNDAVMRWWTNYGDLIRSLNHEFAELRLRLSHMEADNRQHRKQIMSIMDDIKAEVTKQTTIVQSVLTLIHGLHDELAAALDLNDTARAMEVLNELRANDAALAEAVNVMPTEAPAEVAA